MKTPTESTMCVLGTTPLPAGSLHARARKLRTMDARGFSLIEVVMVIVLISIMIMLALPGLDEIKTRAQNARAMSEVRSLEKSIYAYNIDKGFMPINISDVEMGDAKDPWGNSYVFVDLIKNPAAAIKDSGLQPLNTDYDLYSKGKKGTHTANVTDPETRDDILRVNDGSFVGLGTQF
jgi:general secretion pathway protein G